MIRDPGPSVRASPHRPREVGLRHRWRPILPTQGGSPCLAALRTQRAPGGAHNVGGEVAARHQRRRDVGHDVRLEGGGRHGSGRVHGAHLREDGVLEGVEVGCVAGTATRRRVDGRGRDHKEVHLEARVRCDKLAELVDALLGDREVHLVGADLRGVQEHEGALARPGHEELLPRPEHGHADAEHAAVEACPDARGALKLREPLDAHAGHLVAQADGGGRAHPLTPSAPDAAKQPLRRERRPRRHGSAPDLLQQLDGVEVLLRHLREVEAPWLPERVRADHPLRGEDHVDGDIAAGHAFRGELGQQPGGVHRRGDERGAVNDPEVAHHPELNVLERRNPCAAARRRVHGYGRQQKDVDLDLGRQLHQSAEGLDACIGRSGVVVSGDDPRWVQEAEARVAR
mmetsp:Transcript_51191/g.147766  ORF Transcript_51191/g.147766 Transcript_51191/m.147766 type:complete len:400 (-) Transcript_51191:1263-2462(-)